MKVNLMLTVIILLIVILLLMIVLGSYLPVLFARVSNDIFETNDICDYGKYTGNFDNETPSSFITSFFPDEIEDTFSDVTYHYKAKRFDTYAYECYLEFVIDDTDLFCEYLNTHVDITEATSFVFDDAFSIFFISNHLDLISPPKKNGAYAISTAEFGCILYSVDEQRIIFTALGVFDGGGTDTSELNYFFERFNIDAGKFQDVYVNDCSYWNTKN